MSLSFVLYALAVAGLVSAAAVLCEMALQAVRRPTRWVWLAAAIATLGIAGFGLLPDRASTNVLAGGQAFVGPSDAAGNVSTLVPMHIATRATSAWEVARPWLPWALAGLSGFGAAFLLGGWTRLRRGRSGWGSARVGETDVRVADDFGPAVIGVIHPEIVLPRHVLDLDADQLSMVLRHENEHRLARDPALLLVGAGLLCTMPWNPLMWFQFRRLRRAIELDCDARVLASGVSAARYGRLLMTMQGAPTRYALATMLQEPASFLERRLMMMKKRLDMTRPVRASALAGVGALLVVVACETPNPTAVQVEPEPTAQAVVVEGVAREVPDESLIRATIEEIEIEDVSTRWQFRGRVYEEVPVELDVSAVRGLVPFMHPEDEVAVYQLSEATVDGTWTVPEGGRIVEGLWLPEGEIELRKPFTVESVTEQPAGTFRLRDPSATQIPLVVVDGVLTDHSLADVSSLDIESIELIKGAAAEAVYGPRGSNGVVNITTKSGAGPSDAEAVGEYEFVEVPSSNQPPEEFVATLKAVNETVRELAAEAEAGQTPATARYTETRDVPPPAGGVLRRRDASDTDPLVVVDGVITDMSLSDLDSSSLASVEVVKGTDATALYGSRARNGVVVVTTR